MHREVGRPLALEDTIDVASSPPVLVDLIGPVRNQAAGGDEEAFEVNCWQLVLGRQPDDQIAMSNRLSSCCRDQAAIRSVRKLRYGTLDLAGIAQGDRDCLRSER